MKTDRQPEQLEQGQSLSGPEEWPPDVWEEVEIDLNTDAGAEAALEMFIGQPIEEA